jgi:hypothetical protein
LTDRAARERPHRHMRRDMRHQHQRWIPRRDGKVVCGEVDRISRIFGFGKGDGAKDEERDEEAREWIRVLPKPACFF